MLTDKFGPKITYSALLFVSSIPCLCSRWRTPSSGHQLRAFTRVYRCRVCDQDSHRFEWFPAKQLKEQPRASTEAGELQFGCGRDDFAGNRLGFWREDGWRYAIGLTGLISLDSALFTTEMFLIRRRVDRLQTQNIGGMGDK